MIGHVLILHWKQEGVEPTKVQERSSRRVLTLPVLERSRTTVGIDARYENLARAFIHFCGVVWRVRRWNMGYCECPPLFTGHMSGTTPASVGNRPSCRMHVGVLPLPGMNTRPVLYNILLRFKCVLAVHTTSTNRHN